MWVVIWIVSFMAAAGPSTAVFTSNEGTDTYQECIDYAMKHRNQMFDYARGFLNLGFDAEVKITELKCINGGTPA
jgi:hypothetical protein